MKNGDVATSACAAHVPSCDCNIDLSKASVIIVSISVRICICIWFVHSAPLYNDTMPQPDTYVTQYVMDQLHLGCIYEVDDFILNSLLHRLVALRMTKDTV